MRKIDDFEDAVFSQIIPSRVRTSFKADFPMSRFVSSDLDLSSIQKADPKARIVSGGGFTRVHLSKPVGSFNIYEILSEANPDVEIEFTEDFLDFSPDASLVKKSKAPLWVVHALGSKELVIQRANG